jgi:DNA-directed RNA polymerase subunit F
MGIFSKLFGISSDIEKELEVLYLKMFQMMMGMSPSQAKSAFRFMLKQAKEESLKEGTSKLPRNFGDIILEKESKDEKIKSMLAKKRNEGVKDQDIRWWWNMHDLERRMMLKHDEWCKVTVFEKFREEDGLSMDEAGKRVGKTYPIFGNPDDTTHTTGEDRPLPFELKDRINIYVEKRANIDPEKFKEDVENSSSLNALIRKEIKKGKI